MKKDGVDDRVVVTRGYEVSGSDYSESITKHDTEPGVFHRMSVVPEPSELEEKQESTKRGLKSRHAQMIALGGTIGTGLFVGSGATLARGGPLFILLCYIIITILVLFVVTAVTEIAAYLPAAGGTMSYFAFRYVSSSMGFAMGWLYW